MSRRILIVEDDDAQRDVIADILSASGFDVRACASGSEALERLGSESFDAMITDMRMPEMTGLEVLTQAKRLRPDMEVVIMTAYSDVRTAVDAMKAGACDYLAKPFEKDTLLVTLDRALERGSLRQENQRLRALVDESIALGNIVGDAQAMRDVFNRVQAAVDVNSTVMIYGESGTGKELVARHVHFAGPRKNKPFVVVNCAAIPDTLVESELFGHEKGAFTGADRTREGKFETADGGTIFLDEIGDMALDSQAKLLRVLQDGVVERVGGGKPRTVDVRVIAATNRDLAKRVKDGDFREDLYFRLDVLSIPLPPLRRRMEDLPLLVDHFREKLSKKLGRPAPKVAAETIEAMRRYRWPGNVRELEHTLEQLFVLNREDLITVEHLPEKFRVADASSETFALPAGGIVLESVEHDLIRQAMTRSGGRIKEAAELLGLTYKTLQYRLKKYDIDRGGDDA